MHFKLKNVIYLKRVLVTGASGLLGGKLINAMSKEYEVLPTHNTRAIHPNSIWVNIVDRDGVSRVVSGTRPDMVVHAAAETDVDKCETDREWAWSVNAEGTKNIAQACAKLGVKLIYVSTDYVFDGRRGLYSEEDEANPVNYYGLTKLKGEEFVKGLCEDFIVARTSVLYGWHPRRLNFATWVIDSLRNGRRISVVEDHYNSPTFANELAEMIMRLVEVDASGVYHVAGGERVSRYEFATKVAEVFQLDKAFILPVKMNDLGVWIARRPRDSSLCLNKFCMQTGIRSIPLNQALNKMKIDEKTT